MKMHISNLLLRGAIPGLMVCTLAFPPDVFGQVTQQDHIVSSQALQQRLEASAAARQRDIETLNSFLSSPVTQQAMQETHVNPEQIKTAIPTLSDQELSNLATRAADAQMKFSAGAFGNRELIIIAVAILVIILVIVAVR
jgi:hypothetical protein